jgi:hypothetical protein
VSADLDCGKDAGVDALIVFSPVSRQLRGKNYAARKVKLL